MMSTRSMVGQLIDKGAMIFEARYCHYDGNTEGVGQALLDNWATAMKGDTQAMVDFLLSTKIGWSSLCGSDFSKVPTWNRPKFDTPEYDTWDTPAWYDDREGEEPSDPIRKDSDLGWLEFAYLFHVETDTLHMYEISYGKLTAIRQVTLSEARENVNA